MNNLVKPSFQTRPYKPVEIVRIVDRLQQYLYIKNGAKPVDMYISEGDENLVMIFKKNETFELYQKWRKRELK